MNVRQVNIAVMCGLALSSILATAASAALPQCPCDVIEVDAKQETRRIAVEGRGPTDLEVGTYFMDLVPSIGKPVPIEVIAIYDQSSGLYWWRLKRSSDAHDRAKHSLADGFWKNYVLYVDSNRMTAIYADLRVLQLVVSESTSRYDSLRDGHDEVIRTLKEVGGKLVTDPWSQGVRVDLSQHFERAVFRDAWAPYPKGTLKIKTVRWRGGQWDIALDGRDGWAARVSLNGDLEIASAVATKDDPNTAPE